MPIERCGVELSQNVDLRYARVDAVGHGDGYQSVGSSNGDRRLCTLLCEGVEPRPCASSQYNSCKATTYLIPLCDHGAADVLILAQEEHQPSAAGTASLAGKVHQRGACAAPAMLPETERAELVSIRGFSMTALVVRALPDLDRKPNVQFRYTSGNYFY